MNKITFFSVSNPADSQYRPQFVLQQITLPISQPEINMKFNSETIKYVHVMDDFMLVMTHSQDLKLYILGTFMGNVYDNFKYCSIMPESFKCK